MNRSNVPLQASVCHVLVIEDNSDCRESLGLLLEVHGFHVDVAADGYEGVRKALADPPSLAFIDIGLPGLDGYQVAAQLREALGSDILLVAYTAWNDTETQARVTRAGFDGHISKSAKLGELTTWLERAATTRT